MFCRHCGREVMNEAYICPSCGGLIKPLPQADYFTQPTETPKKGKARLARLSRIFSKLGGIFGGIGLGFFLLQIVGWIIIFAVNSYTGAHQNADGFVYEWYRDILLLATMFILYGLIFSLIFVSIAAEAATAGFVMGLIQAEDKAVKKRGITVFIFTMVTALFAVGFGSFGWIYMILLIG